MADHHTHGKMDTTAQEKTFENFMWFVSRGSILIVVILIFLALVGA